MITQIFLFIGFPEIMIILIVALLLFGTDKLPEVARGLGKTLNEIRHTTTDIKREIKNSVDETKITESNLVKDINQEINKVKDEVEDFSGSIKREL